MDRDVILEIQEALWTLSFFDPRLIPLAVDGIYGAQTADAVRIFQSLYGLNPTGEVDSATWEELLDSVSDVRGVLPIALAAFPHPAFVLRPNEEHELALLVQLILTVLSKYYENIDEVTLTGVYDPATVEEIRRIQAMHRIEPSGVINAATWNVLATLYNNRLDTAKR